MFPKENILSIKRGKAHQFEYVPSIFLYSDRKIYASDPTTDAFEIK